MEFDELPEAWEVTKLSEVCETATGGTPSRNNPDYFRGQIPWVKSGELEDTTISEAKEGISKQAIAESNAKVFPKGTVLMAMYGATVGKLGRLEIDAATNQAVCAFFPGKKLNSGFLWHYLRGIRGELIHNSFGAAQPNISQTLIRNLEIPIPPLAEQRRIVARVEALTRRLDQARQVRQAAISEATSVFQRVLENKFSDEAAEDWREMPAEKLFEIVSGQVSPLDPKFKHLPYLGPEHVESGTGRIIGERVSVEKLEMKSGKYVFSPEHVVYSKIRPALRKVCLPDYDGLCSADMYALKPNADEVTREFLLFLLLAPPFSQYAVEKSDRNAMPKINQTALFDFTFRVPDKPEQKRISKLLLALRGKVDELQRLQREVEAELASFTPALLAKAFRGEL